MDIRRFNVGNFFDYETAKTIIENNFAFKKMREKGIFTFQKNCYQWDGKYIVDGCDEYCSAELSEILCKELSKGFAELSLCFRKEG